MRRAGCCASACRRRRSRSRRSRASWSGPARTARRRADCTIVDIGHARERDLALEVPPSPLEAVMSNEVWEQVYDRLAELIEAHRTTLVFVNTRRMAERVARHLAERLGEDQVAAHHGSLAQGAAARRRAAAQARRAEGAGRHRVARARHRHRRRRPGLPARLAALDRQLPAARRPLRPRGRRHAEGAAVPAVARRAGRMRGAARLRRAAASSIGSTIPAQPLDVLAQQIVAEVAAREWDEDAAVRAGAPRLAVPRARARASSTRSCACWPTASPRAAAGAARCCTATPSTACCAAGAARA